jgi:predicted permease
MLDVALDWRLVSFAIGVACLVTPLFAVLPALSATRVEPGGGLKEQSRTLAGAGAHTLGQALVLGQIAMSLALVVLAGLLVGTFTRLASRPLGIESRRVVVADLRLQPDAVAPEERTALFERIRRVVGQVPGVDMTALATVTPMSGRGWNSSVVDIDGTDVGGDVSHRRFWATGVSDGFFATYGIAIRAGRDLSSGDAADAPAVIVVNEAFVRHFLGNGPALGRRVRHGVPGRPDTYAGYLEIVGVVADSVYRRDLRRELEPGIFVPLGQTDGPLRESVTVAARSRASDAAALVTAISQAVDAADSRVSSRVVAHQVYVHNALTQERLIATVAGLFGGLALVLAIVGLYGVTAYTVSRRRTEIGVRLALGATPTRVVQLVVGRVALLVAAGIVVGVGLSLWAGRAVRVLLHGLEPNDPITLFGAATVLLLTAGLAGLIPAWRAAWTDPAAAIRQ